MTTRINNLHLCTFIFRVLLSLNSTVRAANITIFGVDPPQKTDTTIISGTLLGVEAIGVVHATNEKGGEGGPQTVYVASEVNGLVVYKNAQTARTFLSTPTTVTYTFRADASHFWMAQTTTMGNEHVIRQDKCVLDSDSGSGSCKQKLIKHPLVVDGAFARPIVGYARYTGRARAWYTVTVSDVEATALPEVRLGNGGVGAMRGSKMNNLLVVITGLVLVVIILL